MRQTIILIIEDDSAIRAILRTALEMEGHTVYTASNGKEGLEVIHTIPKPCVILLDLMMPVMNGWGFLENISQNKKFNSIPVVIMTAYSEKAATLENVYIIKKPIEINALLKVIQTYCSG